MKTHFCANCLQPVELNVHGKCSTCDSQAVDTLERIPIPRPPHPMKKVFDYMLDKMEGRA